MPKVKLTSPILIAGEHVKAGSVVDVSNSLAADLISSNRAINVAEDAKEKKGNTKDDKE